MAIPMITAQTLRRLMQESVEEYAVIDVREQGVHAEGHPLLAVSLPLSQIELLAPRLMPRKSVAIYLLDQGPDLPLAERAAEVLQSLGYDNLSLVEEGVVGWHDAGFELFTGVNVPSKAFGEFVEATYGTPSVTAEELAGRQAAGERLLILDSRPFAEFHRMSIPGGLNMPGAELLYRLHETISDETTPIIVNCAGRTRSIIGAQSLINAGIKNPVAALKDGTMGWHLAGFELARGAELVAPAPGAAALEKSRARARQVAVNFGVKSIDLETLAKLQSEAAERSLFLFDVRTEEEYLAAHLPGARHAPGGQLVQASDEYIGVRNARIVLIDDCAVRGVMTASWLVQMNWPDVYVLTAGPDAFTESGPPPGAEIKKAETITPYELDAVLASGEAVAVVDLAPSRDYRRGHIPGAFWAIRSRFAKDHIFMAPVGLLVLTSPDGELAHLAAAEVARLLPRTIVRVLGGGTRAWQKTGLPLEAGETQMLSRADDVWYKPYDYEAAETVRRRMEEYLAWEIGLPRQLARDGVMQFRRF